MQALKSTLSDRQAVWAFVLGCIAVTAGMCAHLPMFAMARSMHYHLAGMQMDDTMLAGMALIVLGNTFPGAIYVLMYEREGDGNGMVQGR